jgi:pilus assembly protein CpaF
MVAGRAGTRLYTLAALVERVLEQIGAEAGEGYAGWREAGTAKERLRLVNDAASYVFAMESVQLTPDDRASIVQRVYSEVFGYGALDALFADDRITTIALLGPHYAAVRYGHGELEQAGDLFDDQYHLQRIIGQLLADAGAELREDVPLIETALPIGDRIAAVNLLMPPLAPVLNADIRLHPVRPLSLDDLVERGVVTGEVRTFLRQLLASPHGFMVVGEPETGKTTLLNALLAENALGAGTTLVERAGEMRVSEDISRRRTVYPTAGQSEVSFGMQIDRALGDGSTCVVIDELRTSEPLLATGLLLHEAPPRYICSVRGVPDAKRLQSALGMMARRACPHLGEDAVHRLYERMPFIVTLAVIRERVQIFSIAEWQSRIDSDYPDYVMLFRYENGAARRTDAQPARWL